MERILALHPEASLQDIYKSCLQDAFGPGHLIPDPARAKRYLLEELAEDDYLPTNAVEATGLQGNYVRIDLALVKDGRLPLDELLSAFVESANSVEAPSLDDWRCQWNEVVRVVEEMQLSLPGYEQEKAQIAAWLAQGEYVLHHSDHYTAVYHPHYRIVNRRIYEERLKPFIQQ